MQPINGPQAPDILADAASRPASETAYVAPRLVYLGEAKGMIRGSLANGYTDTHHDFYSTGE